MPILADALEEAGCDDLELLAHCREANIHTATCWALERISRRVSESPTPTETTPVVVRPRPSLLARPLALKRRHLFGCAAVAYLVFAVLLTLFVWGVLAWGLVSFVRDLAGW